MSRFGFPIFDADNHLYEAEDAFLPEFDPFWARIQESGIVVALHQSDSGYQEHVNAWEGQAGEFVAFRPKTFTSVVDGGARAIHDTLASAVCHGMLHRFPGVKLVSVENGGDWVPALPEALQADLQEDADRVR
jgi:hypothetical protein